MVAEDGATREGDAHALLLLLLLELLTVPLLLLLLLVSTTVKAVHNCIEFSSEAPRRSCWSNATASTAVGMCVDKASSTNLVK
jgi:hypothetical protein